MTPEYRCVRVEKYPPGTQPNEMHGHLVQAESLQLALASVSKKFPGEKLWGQIWKGKSNHTHGWYDHRLDELCLISANGKRDIISILDISDSELVAKLPSKDLWQWLEVSLVRSEDLSKVVAELKNRYV